MKTALVDIVGVSPYSQSAPFREAKTKGETHEEFEKRIWRERCHHDSDGNIFIPPMAFKNCLSEAAKYKPMKIPGQGKSTYTKHVESGVMCNSPVLIGHKFNDVQGEWLFVPSDGRRGGSTRVWKNFPVFHNWKGTVEFIIVDDLVSKEVFEEFLGDAGRFIGVGRFRPRNNGYYGRFAVQKIKWV